MNMFQKLLTCLFDIMPNKIEYITAKKIVRIWTTN
jgi:hypothetical protein